MYKKIDNGTKITLQGLDMYLPPLGYGYDIDTGEMKPVEIIQISDDPEEQIWKRQELPEQYNEWVRDEKAKQQFDPTYLNFEYEKYRQNEWHKRLFGIWYYINGQPIYITGSYYFFLNWWQIKEGYPEYRLVDLHYFYFWQYCVYDSSCFGMIQMTKRRGAKTVKAACILYERVSRTMSAKGGIQSKKKDPDAKDFYDVHVISPFQKLPEFYIPVYNTLKGTKPANELSFFATSVRGKNAVASLNQEQLASEIDYREAEPLAYDGTNLLVLVNDERGKVDFDLISAHLLVRKCVMDLRGNITGKMIVCTTVEEIGVKARFPELWEMSNQYKKGDNTSTESGLYRFFTPADEAGDWDKFGVPKTHENRQRILSSRKLLENDSKALIDEIRKDPLDEREAFMVVNNQCHFDALLLNNIYSEAKAIEREALEYGNFTWKDGIRFSQAVWKPCNKENARWGKAKNFELPDPETTVHKLGEVFRPTNHIQFISGCDPFQNDIVENGVGSKASSGILNRYESGSNDEYYDKMFVMKYHARPAIAELFHMDMALQCFAFGCQMLVEAKQDGGLRKFFVDNNLNSFLIYLAGKQNAGIDPNADNKALLVNLWETYIENQGRKGKLIFPSVIHQLGLFNVNETEKYDEVMGLGWTLVADYFKKANFKKNKSKANVGDYFKRHKLTA